MTFARELIGVADATPGLPRIIRAVDQHPPRPKAPDEGTAYRDHLEAELEALHGREAKLVAELEQLARRFGVTLPVWVGSREPRPIRKHRPSSPVRTNARTGAALLGRLGRTPEPVAGLALDPATGRVLLDGRLIHLTPIERLLLTHLLDRPGRLVSRAELVRAAWGGGAPTGADKHRLRINVARLRKALGAAGWTGSLTSETNLGYILEVERP